MFRTCRVVVRDADKLNQLAARSLPLLFEPLLLGEHVVDGGLIGNESGEPGDER